jgi:hypothetical protein
VTSSQVKAIARALTPPHAGAEQSSGALVFAKAQAELVRIREIRKKLLRSLEASDFNTRQLHRLAALDRYERYAHTRRRRASLNSTASKNEITLILKRR